MPLLNTISCHRCLSWEGSAKMTFQITFSVNIVVLIKTNQVYKDEIIVTVGSLSPAKIFFFSVKIMSGLATEIGNAFYKAFRKKTADPDISLCH